MVLSVGGGGATRPLPSDMESEEFRGNPTSHRLSAVVQSHPSIEVRQWVEITGQIPRGVRQSVTPQSSRFYLGQILTLSRLVKQLLIEIICSQFDSRITIIRLCVLRKATR